MRAATTHPRPTSPMFSCSLHAHIRPSSSYRPYSHTERTTTLPVPLLCRRQTRCAAQPSPIIRRPLHTPPPTGPSRLTRRMEPSPGSLRRRLDSLLNRTADDSLAPAIAQALSQAGKEKSLPDLERVEVWLRGGMAKGTLKPNVFVFTALIDGYGRCGDLGKAEQLCEELKQLGIKPTTATYTTLLEAYLKRGFLARAEQILQRMRAQGVQPNERTWAPLIVYYANRGLVDKAKALLDEVQQQGLQPTAVSYAAYIDGCVGANKKEELLFLLASAACQSHDVQRLVLQGLVALGLQSGDYATADEWMGKFIRAGHRPLAPSLGAIISGFSEQRNIPKMERWLSYMLDTGIRPNKATFNKAISGYLRAEQVDPALALLQKMNDLGEAPDTVTYNAFLNCFGSSCQIDRMEAVLADMLTLKLPLSDVSYRILHRAYMRHGQEDKARKIVEIAKQNGVALLAGASAGSATDAVP